MTYTELFLYIKDKLEGAGIPEPESESRIIMREIAGADATMLNVHGGTEISDDIERNVMRVISRRVAREPLQYILGRWDFMGLDFMVDASTLIPRPDTETLVECAMKHLHDGMRILDLCTGTGCILISLLNYSNDCTGVGSDISDEAVMLARKNADHILRDPGSAEFVCGDLYTPINGKFDIIVSNPPYIPSAVIEGLEPEVRDHEPKRALDGGADGLDLIKRIVFGAEDHLVKGGSIFTEIGFDQGNAVAGLYVDAGFVNVEVLKDLAGNDRVVFGTRPIIC